MDCMEERPRVCGWREIGLYGIGLWGWIILGGWGWGSVELGAVFLLFGGGLGLGLGFFGGGFT